MPPYAAMSDICDVIVLGSGAAGLTAALAAHESGADVRVIERFDRIGGTSAVSGGVIWVADNPRQRAAGLADSRAEALAYFRSLDHGDLRDDVLEAFVDTGPEALGFLEDIDALRVSLLAGYPDYYLDRPGAKPEGGRALDHDLFALGELGKWAARIYAIEEPKPMMLRETALGGGSGVVPTDELHRRIAADERGFGQAMIGRLLKACLARRIEPVLGVQTKRLTRDGGRITGIEGARNGEPFELSARHGVIVATGGFEWDAGLRQTFLRGPADTPASPPTARGEGLALAMAAGASLGNMTSAWWAPTLAPPGESWPTGEQRAAPVLIERTVPHGLMVNRAGLRFCNEAANYSALAGAFHAFDPQTYSYRNQPAWLVFDAQDRARYPIGPVVPGAPLPTSCPLTRSSSSPQSWATRRNSSPGTWSCPRIPRPHPPDACPTRTPRTFCSTYWGSNTSRCATASTPPTRCSPTSMSTGSTARRAIRNLRRMHRLEQSTRDMPSRPRRSSTRQHLSSESSRNPRNCPAPWRPGSWSHCGPKVPSPPAN